MEHNDITENYKHDENTLNLFEKVLITTTRAKDLYTGKTPLISSITEHKPTTIALYEVNHGLINPLIEETSNESKENKVIDF